MPKLAKVLLVDDDLDFIAATRAVLETLPCEIVTANTGEEGLRMAKQEMPDLILMDVIMPVRDGFTAAEQIKKDPQLRAIPVIMLTAFSAVGQGSSIPRNRGMSLETEDYLEKPVKPSDLLAKVRPFLRT